MVVVRRGCGGCGAARRCCCCWLVVSWKWVGWMVSRRMDRRANCRAVGGASGACGAVAVAVVSAVVISGVLVHGGWLEVAGSGQGRSASVGMGWFVDVFMRIFRVCFVDEDIRSSGRNW